MCTDYPYLSEPLQVADTIFTNRIFPLHQSKIEVCLCSQIPMLCNLKYNDLSQKEISMLPELFAEAALKAVEQGYKIAVLDATENTIIADSILGNKTSFPMDSISIIKRLRLTREIIKNIRQAVGNSLLIELSMKGAEFTNQGYTSDEGLEIAKMLADKVDLIRLSVGINDTQDSFIRNNPNLMVMHGSNIRLASRFKKCIQTPIAIESGLNSYRMMNDILAANIADFIYSDLPALA